MSNISVGYSDGDTDTNHSGNASLNAMIEARYSRRLAMLGGLRASTQCGFCTPTSRSR